MLGKALLRLSFGAVLVLPCAARPSNNGSLIVPQVDQRVELLSIVFRLAGNFEYNMSPLSSYSGDIDTYFGPYRNHPAVVMAKSLAEKNGVSFDAVMSMAVSLSDPPALTPVVPFTEDVPEPRWGKENALKFVSLLQDFHRDTHFDKFFVAHRALYELAENRFQNVLNEFDIAWYRKFYGEIPSAQFHVFLGMNNGAGNYGPHVELLDGHQEIFAIIGAGRKDDAGNPAFGRECLSLIVHEFNHSFINRVADQHSSDFAPAEKVYQTVVEQMKRLAYGNAQTMIDESLVRAAAILYFESKGDNKQQTGKRIIGEQAVGFVWMDDLCDLLGKYESQRDRYPTFRSFMPVVVDFYRDLSNHIGEKRVAFDRKRVHVTSIQPFANHSQTVDPAMSELTVTFDKALEPGRYSLNWGPDGKDHYPLVGDPGFAPDQRSIKLHLQLKPHWTYCLLLSSAAFASTDGYPLEDYPIDFTTK